MSDSYPTIAVKHRMTGEQKCYALPPRKALLSAYAQSQADFALYDYERKYGHLIWETKRTLSLGDWFVTAILPVKA